MQSGIELSTDSEVGGGGSQIATTLYLHTGAIQEKNSQKRFESQHLNFVHTFGDDATMTRRHTDLKLVTATAVHVAGAALEPDPPAHLPATGLAEWQRRRREFGEAPTPGELEDLACYARSYGAWVDMEAWLAERGPDRRRTMLARRYASEAVASAADLGVAVGRRLLARALEVGPLPSDPEGNAA